MQNVKQNYHTAKNIKMHINIFYKKMTVGNQSKMNSNKFNLKKQENLEAFKTSKPEALLTASLLFISLNR